VIALTAHEAELCARAFRDASSVTGSLSDEESRLCARLAREAQAEHERAARDMKNAAAQLARQVVAGTLYKRTRGRKVKK
jgi:hypothetical protein